MAENYGSGLAMATLGVFAGLTSIVFYGVAGPEVKESLSLWKPPADSNVDPYDIIGKS